MKVSIENFQNIDQVDLEIEGLTTVVGKSNIGKSSIVRAIKGAIENKGGDSFVRKGHKYAKVSIDCPEVSLIWKKGDGKNHYEIDGEEYYKVGRGSPDIVREKGFGEVETDRASVNPQIATQFNPIFLLNPSKTSGSVAAEIISDIGRLSDIQVALKESSRERRQVEKTLQVREEDLQDYEEDLEKYDGLDEVLSKVDEISDLREEVKSLKSELEKLEYLKDKRDRVSSKIKRLSSIQSIDIPERSFEESVRLLRDLASLSEDYASSKERYDKLKGIESIDIPEQSFEKGVRLLHDLMSLSENYASSKERYEELKGVEEVEVPSRMDMESSIEKISSLSSVGEEFKGLEKEVSELNLAIQEEEDKIDQIDEKLENLFREAGKCPMCERETQ